MKRQKKARPWHILEFTQSGGFKEIEFSPSADEAERFTDMLRRENFGGEEEVEGQLIDIDYIDGIKHYYNDETGARLTEICGACRTETVLTKNAADHLALRIALAPLAAVKLAAAVADGQAEHGSLKEWRKHVINSASRYPKK